jgi:radical SAM modification target selenobiotic family peptide
MDQRELKQLLVGVSLAALVAAVTAVGCAHAEKSSGDDGKSGGGQKTQGGGASGCGGGMSGCGGSKK